MPLYWPLAFAILFLASSARADVVLSRFGTASGSADIASGTYSSIRWTAGYTGSFDTVKIRVNDNASSNPITALGLEIKFGTNTSGSITGTRTYAVGQQADFEFDLSTLTGRSFNSGDTGYLYFRLDNSSGDPWWSTTDVGVTESLGWGLLSTSTTGGQFSLSATATAVP